MKNMHIKHFVVLSMALLMLGKNADCQLTFDNATKIWQEQSCIFPDKSAYITDTLNIMPLKLEPCRLLDNKNISADPDGVLKTKLCQSFYSATIRVCQNKNETWQSFTQRCLKPDLLQQRKPFVEKGVCAYAFKSTYLEYFRFLQTSDVCQRICGVNSMRDICELYAFLFYQLENLTTCSETEQPGAGTSNSVAKSNQEGHDLTSVTQKSTNTPSTSYQTESTPTTQLTSLASANKTEGRKDPIIESTNDAVNTTGNNTTPSTTDNKTLHSDDTSATKEDGLKTLGPSKDEFKIPELPTEGSKTSQPSKDKLESSTSLLISKITSTTTKETKETTPTQEEEESTTIANQSTSQEKDDGDSEEDDKNYQEGPGSNDGQLKEILDSSNDDKEEGDESKTKTQGSKSESGKEQPQDTFEKNNNQGVNDDDDAESSPGSGHFLAYFLTAVVICISGYIIYHNKQKILAFIIEGRNSGRGGRKRSKDVKYTQLKSSVEEVMPSLDQTATGKNFVY